MKHLGAKDLTTDVPRSPYAELEGFPWLARLIDKVRAMLVGTLGDYTPYPSGGDEWFVEALELDADALMAKISEGASDEDVAAWVRSTMAVSPQVLDQMRAEVHETATGDYAAYLEGAKAELAEARPELDLSRVKNQNDLFCAEEGHPIP